MDRKQAKRMAFRILELQVGMTHTIRDPDKLQSALRMIQITAASIASEVGRNGLVEGKTFMKWCGSDAQTGDRRRAARHIDVDYLVNLYIAAQEDVENRAMGVVGATKSPR